ncbi:MAG TPA: hypothetical protein VKY44_01155 [Flavobacterium sp.]|nr:hypothetical protein [Flavobacterium sp.]HLW62428.1 hypothetical protein [Flavobacterium sp.]
MKIIFKLLCLSIVFISCDKEMGIHGVIVDSDTGLRVSDVKAKMISQQGDRETTSRTNGYFATIIVFNCGIASCNDDFSVEFVKEGYKNKVITESYYESSEAEFVNPDKKDTVIIKLEKL